MNSKIKSMTLCAMFAALTAIGAFIRIPIPQLDFTLQLIFVALAGTLLGPRLGLYSQLLYIAIGLSGLQIFAKGGGISYIFQTSFGYLIGFALAAFVIGYLVNKMKKITYIKIFGACLLGLLVVYLIGIPYLYIILKYNLNKDISIEKLLWIGCGSFMILDIIKMALVALISMSVLPVTKNIFKKY